MKLEHNPSIGLSAPRAEDLTSNCGRLPGAQPAAASAVVGDMISLSGEKELMARAADNGLIASQNRLGELSALVSRGAYRPDAIAVSEALIQEAESGT